MRTIAFVVMPLLLGLFCSGQPTPGPVKNSIDSITQTPNYTITLTPPSGGLSLQAPLLVEMFYTNTTTSDIYMTADVCRICTGERILLTKDGKEVEATPFQRMSTGRGLPSDFKDLPPVTANSMTRRYRPGVFWKFNLDLRKLYNITEPGQYTLTATRTEETVNWKFEVHSNTITLNIVQ